MADIRGKLGFNSWISSMSRIGDALELWNFGDETQQVGDGLDSSHSGNEGRSRLSSGIIGVRMDALGLISYGWKVHTAT